MDQTPKKHYSDQKHHAKERGIEWDMSYAEWLEMWLISGQYENRGRSGGKYCMCRIGDIGPYSSKNCFISTTDHNQQDRWEGDRKVMKDEWRDVWECYMHTDMPQWQVAEKFGIGQPRVSRIIKMVRQGL